MPIITGPIPTFDIGMIGTHSVDARIRIDAARIGFHVEPDPTGAGPSTHYLTVSPIAGQRGDVALLALSGSPGATDRVLAVINSAVADGLVGELDIEVYPIQAMGRSEWYVMHATYTDAEGERHSG